MRTRAWADCRKRWGEAERSAALERERTALAATQNREQLQHIARVVLARTGGATLPTSALREICRNGTKPDSTPRLALFPLTLSLCAARA